MNRFEIFIMLRCNIVLFFLVCLVVWLMRNCVKSLLILVNLLMWIWVGWSMCVFIWMWILWVLCVRWCVVWFGRWKGWLWNMVISMWLMWRWLWMCNVLCIIRLLDMGWCGSLLRCLVKIVWLIFLVILCGMWEMLINGLWKWLMVDGLCKVWISVWILWCSVDFFKWKVCFFLVIFCLV